MSVCIVVILCITSGYIASTKFKVVLHGLRFGRLSVLGDNWLNYRPVTYQTTGMARSLVWLARCSGSKSHTILLGFCQYPGCILYEITSKHDNSGQSFISCILCTVGILYGCTSASLLALCLFCPIYLIPCRFSLQLYNGLFPRYCLFGCRDSLRFHCFQPSFLRSFPLPALLQCRVYIFFWLLGLVCGQSYHYHAHLAHGVHI